MATEKSFEEKVKSFLKDQGCWFIKYWGGGEFTKAGVPDILCCCNSRFLGIEVKGANGRPSALQIHNLKKIHEAGGFGILLYPDEFDVFKTLITKMNDNKWDDVAWFYGILKKRWDK